jgi:hypothetical protein
MSGLDSILGGWTRLRPMNQAIAEQVIQRPALRRVMEFTGHNIHDVVNDPIAKNEVIGYFKLHKMVLRRCEQDWD